MIEDQLGARRRVRNERDQSTETRLKSLLAVTDTALAGLDVEDLLGELLTRVRDVLEADTAAVLLFDPATDELVATAAQGIEEEVRLGVRIPVGTGFAGRIARTNRPVALDRVDVTTVANPILWETGIRVMLGVPLNAGGRLIGVLHVGRLDHRPFGTHDTEILQVVGERVAGAIQTRQLAIERAAAAQLERSLRPERLPVCPGLELAARYLTPEARSVGGDWYDVFVGPEGELWVVIGDVVGHGLGAAVVMGRVKSALRAYTLLGGGPDEVLELTDRKVQHFEVDSMVTLLCAVSRPPYGEFTVSSAGHLPPIVARADEAAELTTIAVDPPLGFTAKRPRSRTTIEVPAGALLLLYTDGLVERRDRPIDDQIDRLRTAVTADAPNQVCTRVLRALLGEQGPTDDVAVVALRRRS